MLRESARPKRLKLILIKPSKYDDDGYVVRHFRGVLPSNTLACLYGLTEDVKRRKVLGENVELDVELFDETVQKIPVRRIIRSHRPAHVRTVVALVGVQSNQYPRAADLAKRFRAGGLPVMIGGFHVTGMLALFPETSPEIQELIDIGVTMVKGEVEDTWGLLLKDALEDKLEPVYDFMEKKPDLSTKPVPMIHRSYLRRFASSNFGTIDCSRGCPYTCTFCTIINVQGREMRVRSAETLAQAMRENYKQHGVDYYFFTDDNFARNSAWRDIFQMLIGLRAEGMPMRFMMQVDTLSYKIPGFIEMAGAAGCTQVFIGMESINPKNLKAAGKNQNHVHNYRELIAAWHQAKVATHVAYIIGFPYDTPESVQEDVERLKHELKVEQVSFFMLTPLPGSEDHLKMARSGAYMHEDLNTYDAFHETVHHPNFKPGEWQTAYRKAWRNFYTFEYMREVLANANPENYWNIFRNFLWYKNSVLVEGGHPMLYGFFRLKERKERRPGFEIESRLRHMVRRFRDMRGVARGWISLILEMEELWLQTRRRSEGEERLLAEIRRVRAEVNRGLKAAELQLAHMRARVYVPGLSVPSRLSLRLRDLNFGLAKRVTYTRADLQKFWNRSWKSWRRRRLFAIAPHKVALNFLRDVQLLLLFAVALMREEEVHNTYS
jgi:radical SAM superfamily enzyme YgiQ (UPF0313 family)